VNGSSVLTHPQARVLEIPNIVVVLCLRQAIFERELYRVERLVEFDEDGERG
jgi:hypothetical protein